MKKVENLTVLTWIACIVISLAAIYVMLISSFEIVAYGSMDYYQSEYEKYGVADNLNMEMEDIMYVTEEMMDFLRGDREDLIIDTVVGGVEREFFNDSEISHMVDVQELFIGGLRTRNISMIVIIVLMVALVSGKMSWKRILPKAFQYTTAAFVVVVGVVGYLFATDFYKYFEIFHKIFFEGDTWLFDVNTSLMINMLPEGLFYDMTLRIVVVFLVMMCALFVLVRVASKCSSQSIDGDTRI